MRRHPSFIASLIVVCAGCSSPSISRFDVTPPVLCEGEKAVISWDANGQVALGVQAELSGTGASNCIERGREILAFTLAAHSGSDEVERRVELVQLQANTTEPIALRANAMEGSAIIANGEKNPALWANRIEVAKISACQNRTITVQHDGKSVMIVPGSEPSDALAGTPLSGVWQMRSTLTADEVKTPSLRPKELAVLATLRCRESNASTQ